LDKKALRVTVHTQCGNCGATLMGPYCYDCGQHVHESARSISALTHDAWHLATHIDGRFWQTLYILLLKPGKLTKEYFAERRARYLPPVRLYLVLSVLFFAFGLAAPQKHRVPPTSAAPTSTAPTATAPTATAPNTAAPGNAVPQEAAAEKIPAAKKKSGKSILRISNCDSIVTSIPGMQDFMRQACARNPDNYAESVEHAFVANIPKMMFVFVPMMALVMLILYWRPRRYYVEHLVFFLHSHAAIFLLLLIQALLGWVALWLAWSTFRGWVIAMITLYSVWYVYRAMRVYYGQGRLLTLTKLSLVGLTYFIGFCITLLATLIVSAIIV
jgi:Protein of unknown function (DUF3667)